MERAEAVFMGPLSSPVYGKKGWQNHREADLGDILANENSYVLYFIFSTEFPPNVEALDLTLKKLLTRMKMLKQKGKEQRLP